MPFNENGIIIPNKPAIQPAQAQDPAAVIFDMLRAIEADQHKSTADLCATMMRVAKAGFKLQIDPTLQPGRAAVVMQHTFKLAIQSEMEITPANIMLLGTAFEPALLTLIESVRVAQGTPAPEQTP